MIEEIKATKVGEEMNSDEGEQWAPPTYGVSTSPTRVEDEVAEAPTLREFFEIPERVSDRGDDHWKAFQKKLAEETRGIRWSAAMPDLGSKIAELLDIKIHDMLLTAWTKVDAVRQAIEDSKRAPDKATYLDLTEHGIDFETKPFIEVKMKSASVKKISLTVAINLRVKGFGLKVQNGAIRELQTGKCEGKGTIKYEKLSIAEKKIQPIKFPLTIEIPNSIPIFEPAAEPVAMKAMAVTEAKTENERERIVL